MLGGSGTGKAPAEHGSALQVGGRCRSGVSREAGTCSRRRRANPSPTLPLAFGQRKGGAKCRAMLGRSGTGKSPAEHGSAPQVGRCRGSGVSREAGAAAGGEEPTPPQPSPWPSAKGRGRSAEPCSAEASPVKPNVVPSHARQGVARRAAAESVMPQPSMARLHRWGRCGAEKGASLARSTPNKNPACAGFLSAANSNRNQRFIEPKNSSLDLVFFILSNRNSIAAISSIGCSSLRRIQIFCSSSGSISRSSRRVPERLMSMAG